MSTAGKEMGSDGDEDGDDWRARAPRTTVSEYLLLPAAGSVRPSGSDIAGLNSKSESESTHVPPSLSLSLSLF